MIPQKLLTRPGRLRTEGAFLSSHVVNVFVLHSLFTLHFLLKYNRRGPRNHRSDKNASERQNAKSPQLQSLADLNARQDVDNTLSVSIRLLGGIISI